VRPRNRNRTHLSFGFNREEASEAEQERACRELIKRKGYSVGQIVVRGARRGDCFGGLTRRKARTRSV
jgi:hypothetical protein